jgi:cell division GTPase FtsZ
MKLTVIGLGQCGCRIADQFARLNVKARAERKAVIAPQVLAVNTDQADLTGLRFIKDDYMHRILIGLRQTLGHGVGKINEVGAQLAKEDGDKVMDAIRAEPKFYETHAFMLIAGAAGGTGSGGIPVIASMIRERYITKPLFALVVLPFEHEQSTEARSVYNTATCLKSIYDVVDAVFLADNQRYVRKDMSLISNVEKINRQIVEPFYDLLCAGEVTKGKFVGSRTVDAGDMIASIEGWTTVGIGRTTLPSFRFPWELNKKKFRDKALESFRGTRAMDATLSELSIDCDPKDAGKALYIIAGPGRELNMDMVKGISSYVKEIAPSAMLRGGDFPGEKHFIDVALILSQLSSVPRVKDFYEQATVYAGEYKGQLEETKKRIAEMSNEAKDLPNLLDE